MYSKQIQLIAVLFVNDNHFDCSSKIRERKRKTHLCGWPGSFGGAGDVRESEENT